jgi:hypothetical protein
MSMMVVMAVMAEALHLGFKLLEAVRFVKSTGGNLPAGALYESTPFFGVCRETGQNGYLLVSRNQAAYMPEFAG